MSGIVKSEREIKEEVKGFYGNKKGYYLVTDSGYCLNIIHLVSLQPKIENENDYLTFLFVEAKEGFFLLTQRIKDFKAGRWVIEKEMIPCDPQNFSQEYQREFEKTRE